MSRIGHDVQWWHSDRQTRTFPKAPIPRFFPRMNCPICTGACSMISETNHRIWWYRYKTFWFSERGARPQTKTKPVYGGQSVRGRERWLLSATGASTHKQSSEGWCTLQLKRRCPVRAVESRHLATARHAFAYVWGEGESFDLFLVPCQNKRSVTTTPEYCLTFSVTTMTRQEDDGKMKIRFPGKITLGSITLL